MYILYFIGILEKEVPGISTLHRIFHVIIDFLVSILFCSIEQISLLPQDLVPY